MADTSELFSEWFHVLGSGSKMTSFVTTCRAREPWMYRIGPLWQLNRRPEVVFERLRVFTGTKWLMRCSQKSAEMCLEESVKGKDG